MTLEALLFSLCIAIAVIGGFVGAILAICFASVSAVPVLALAFGAAVQAVGMKQFLN